ncbi:hypothetical protein QQF64_022662 [Cirrhinus molitorella]|uniref:Uncharacterized protein n=1 Tax=Cirrhinus molitorella TaxID=172907 RepID=A0ABR3L5G5_9TELE
MKCYLICEGICAFATDVSFTAASVRHQGRRPTANTWLGGTGLVWWRIARHSCRASELIRKKVAWTALKGIHEKPKSYCFPSSPTTKTHHPKRFTSSRQPFNVIIACLECLCECTVVRVVCLCSLSRSKVVKWVWKDGYLFQDHKAKWQF